MNFRTEYSFDGIGIDVKENIVHVTAACLSDLSYSLDVPRRLEKMNKANCDVSFVTSPSSEESSGQVYLLAVKGDVLYVAFRGTANNVDYLVDSAAIKSCNWIGCVHLGFRYRSEMAPLRLILDYLGKSSSARVVLTGHSLGGAVATLVASKVWEMMKLYGNVSEQKRVSVVTFGAPAVGDPSFVENLGKHFEGHLVHNYIVEDDIVPRILGLID